MAYWIETGIPAKQQSLLVVGSVHQHSGGEPGIFQHALANQLGNLLRRGRLREPFANQLARAFVATTVAGAKQVLATAEAWAAIVIDVELSDGSGLDVLAVGRRWHPQTPALVVTGSPAPEVLNAAFDLGAGCIAKPLDAARLRHFLSVTSKARDSVADIARKWTVRYRLSKGEADVLLKAARGSTRAEIATSRGTSPHTVQLQEMAVRRKTADASFRSAVARLLREAAGCR